MYLCTHFNIPFHPHHLHVYHVQITKLRYKFLFLKFKGSWGSLVGVIADTMRSNRVKVLTKLKLSLVYTNGLNFVTANHPGYPRATAAQITSCEEGKPDDLLGPSVS